MSSNESETRVWCFSSLCSLFKKLSLLSRCPSPSHQLPSYHLSLHLEIFSSASLFPDNSISITLLPTYSWFLLITCPYHLSLPSLIFIPNGSTLTVPLMYSLLILSFLFTPIAHLKIFISATSTSSTCFL